MSSVKGSISAASLDTTLGEALQLRADQHPDRIAVISVHENITKTFAELNGEVSQLANVLRCLFKLKVGDVAAIWSFNCYDYVVIEYACARAGVVISLFDPNWKKSELEKALELCQPKVLFLPSRESPQNFNQNLSEVFECSRIKPIKSATNGIRTVFIEDIKDLMSGQARTYEHSSLRPTSRSLCFILFTSGSSGPPKAAQLSHFAVFNAANARALFSANWSDQRICLPVPIHHTFGTVSTLRYLCISGSTVLLVGYTYSTTAVMSAMEKFRCHILETVPTIILDVLQKVRTGSYDLKEWTTLATAGAAMPLDSVRELFKLVPSLVRLSVAYGSTETGAVSYSLHDKDMLAADRVLALPLCAHVAVKVVDMTAGDLVPFGQEGLLLVKTPFFMDGYLGQAGFLDKDGFYNTGDIGCLDMSGRLTIKGRASEIISRGAEKISPLEIEEVLSENKRILKAAVFGLPDKRLGQEVCVWAQVVDTLQTRELDIVSFLSSRLAPYKVPKYVIVSKEDPPLTGSNKILKTSLVRMAMDKFGLN